MKKIYSLIILLLNANFILAQSTGGEHLPVDTKQKGGARRQDGNGINFTPNKGQIVDMDGKLRPDILFKTDRTGADIYIRKTGISYVYSNSGELMHELNERIERLEKAGNTTEAIELESKQTFSENQTLKIHRVDMEFANCNKNVITINEDEVEGYNNYYYAHCPNGITNVKQYNKITCRNIYNNIDVSYYGNTDGGLKYDLIVKPYADPNQIKLHWMGMENVHMSRDGNLVIKTCLNEFYESIPKVYQIINEQIVGVKASYVLHETTVSFEFGTWNPEYPLIIDPWASYYGGNNEERGLSVTTDPSGNVAFTGYTGSTNFPVSPGAFQPAIPTGDNRDAFVVKMNAAGNRLWATYYGGYGWDFGTGIASDNIGNILVTGHTMTTTFPVSTGAFQPVYGGGNNQGDAFLIQLNPAGARVWATYYGGLYNDAGTDVTTDGSNIYLYGTASSGNAIATPGTFQPVFNGVANGTNLDCFVAKFSSAGNRLWGTYIGGTGTNGECSDGIACDPATGNIYISGTTNSNDFPVTPGAYLTTPSGPLSGAITNAFLCKLSPAGLQLWSTYYYTGNGFQNGSAVAVDGLGNVILGGDNGSDSFLAKFNSAGVFLWNTGLGANAGNYISDLDLDGDNNIYAYGEFEDMGPGTYAGTCPYAYQPKFGGSFVMGTAEDEFISKYDPNGKQLCFTFVGGPGEDELDPSTGFKGTFGGVGTWGGGSGIAIYKNMLYITGAAPAGYPITTGAFQTNFGGSYPWLDAFIDQLCINFCEQKTLGIDFIPSTRTACANTPITFAAIVNNSCDTSGYKFKWTFTGGTPGSSASSNPSVSYSTPGSYSVKLVVTTPCKKDSVISSNYITVASCTINATTTTATTCPGSCAAITATGSNGTAPYTFSWSNGATSQTINVCPAANTTYTVKVTDANGATVVVTPTITVKLPMIISTSATNITCSVAGSAAVTSISGMPPFTYSWSTGGTSYNIQNIAAGSYTITITDGNGCTGTKAINITSSSPASAAFTFTPACAGQPVIFTNTGSAGTYTWTVYPSNPAVSGATANFTYTFLSAGTYSVTHNVNTSGCTATVISNITVVNCNAPAATATGNSICPGSCTTVTSSGTGGTNPYTYLWSTGATTQNINPCPASTTTYTVTVKDMGGYTSTSIAIVTVNPAVTTTASSTSINCNGGTGSVSASGGSGTSPYTYSWNNNQTTQTVTGLTAGNYAVTVTDNKGCTSTSIITITSPLPLLGQFSKGTANCASCGCKEWVMVNATGGTSPYTYTWPDGYINRYKNQLCPGTYNINIIDKNGCNANINLTAP